MWFGLKKNVSDPRKAGWDRRRIMYFGLDPGTESGMTIQFIRHDDAIVRHDDAMCLA